MELYCTRPSCTRPANSFPDLDDSHVLIEVKQKYCITCGMTLILGDRYIPTKLLGQGGFGAAFLARDRYTPAQKLCVVKLFKPDPNLNAQQLQVAKNLFQREGEVLEQLGHHPQIPDLYAFFPVTVNNAKTHQQEQFFYLVQEFIDGQNLEQELEQKGQISEAEVLEVLTQILGVLQFVHEQGSIHRDIKPSNIMRKSDGQLFLLDFGAVKKATVGGGQIGRSTGVYTPGYAPTEQMTGGQVYPSTDLYALAVTCIQLLTGKHPNDLFDTFNSQWDWQKYLPQIPPNFANILNKMLQSAPNQRYPSAKDVLLAINPPFPSTFTPTPDPVSPPVNPTPPVLSPSKSKFSLVETLIIAGTTGAETGLLLIIALKIGQIAIAIPLLLILIGGLIYVRYQRILEGKDLPIIMAITLGLALFLPRVNKAFSLEMALIIFLLCTAGAIAFTALFRLVYNLLSKLFSDH
jgi:serine/threonine protein kinase